MSRPSTGWLEHAACSSPTADPDWWDTENRLGNRTARQWCMSCPVRDACLEAAMREEGGSAVTDRTGIRGGLSPARRRHLYLRRTAEQS